MAVNTYMLTPNYAQKWNWRVEIDGYDRAHFTTGDRPKASFEVVEFNPGGTHRPVKAPGRATFDDLTFEKGVLLGSDADFIEWMQELLSFAEGTSESNRWDNLFKTIDIVEYNQADEEINRWRLYGAFISNFDGNDLDGGASEVMTESITITYQFFTRA